MNSISASASSLLDPVVLNRYVYSVLLAMLAFTAIKGGDISVLFAGALLAVVWPMFVLAWFGPKSAPSTSSKLNIDALTSRIVRPAALGLR